MSTTRKAKKQAKGDPNMGPGWLNYMLKIIKKIEAREVAGITYEQAKAMEKLDRRVKNRR
jgi:hypothetical protein